MTHIQFKRLSTRLILAWILLAAAMTATYVVGLHPGVTLFFGACWMGVAVVNVVLSFRYWRCPHCGRHLGRENWDYCGHCGKPL